MFYDQPRAVSSRHKAYRKPKLFDTHHALGFFINPSPPIIKDAYNELISDKTIQNNVKLIDSTIDSCVEKLSNQTGAVSRLEKIVTIAFDGEEDSEEEDGKEKI